MKDEEFAALQVQLPGKRLARIKTAAGEIVCRQPTRVEHGVFKKVYFDPNVAAAVAYENLLVTTAVAPDRETLSRWLEDYPGISMNVRVVKALKQLSGEADEEEGK
jgi:hypothetical protein